MVGESVGRIRFAKCAARLWAVAAMSAALPGAPAAWGQERVMPGEVRFAEIAFTDLPGWADDDHAAALQAFRRSCDRLMAINRLRSAGSAKTLPVDLTRSCEQGRALPRNADRAAARAFFERHFLPHRVVHGASQGLLTGYFEPVLDGSRTPDTVFKTPVYRRPPELVNLVEETLRGATGAALTHARKTQTGLEPFATRSEIESGALAGRNLELLYLADPVDVFFMQIQGSARIKLRDGSTVRIGYDGKNGHPYTSIGRRLIEMGQLAADKMSLDALAKWLRADPERGRRIMWENASFVFFRELAGERAQGPLGVHEILLTPGRSLAVDAGVHAIGTPVYVTAATLKHATPGQAFQRLMIAQDVGSAIKGPERGDIYFGSGSAAGRRAGVTKHPGNFFVLLPRTNPP